MEAADHEKQVDADKTAARNERDFIVVEQHRQDRQRPQAVDVGAVFGAGGPSRLRRR